MTDGIPIPTGANGYLCAGCGCYIGTGYPHAAACPSLVKGHILTDEGKKLIEQLAARLDALEKRVGELEAQA